MKTTDATTFTIKVMRGFLSILKALGRPQTLYQVIIFLSWQRRHIISWAKGKEGL
jgi:hypothetical protein